MEWLSRFESQVPEGAITWLVIAILTVILLLLLLTLYRRVTGGLFIAGGRSRKARLAVMDAAPVDAHRRLVLVRRDDIEHLVMIGGPSDIVVEQNIRLGVPVLKPRSIMDEAEPARPAAMGAETAGDGEVPVERRRVLQPAAAVVTPAPEPVTASVTPISRPAKPDAPAVRPANGNGDAKSASLLTAAKPAAAAEPAKPKEAAAPKPAPAAKAEADKETPAAPVRKTIFGTPLADKPKDVKPAQAQPAAPAKEPEATKEAVAAPAPVATNVKPASEPAKPAAAAAKDVSKETAADATPTDELEEEMERLLSELTGTGTSG